jgi:adenosylcobinamide-phosphate synthase
MAGALRVRLGGPAVYEGVVTPRPWFGDGPAPGADDLARGLAIYARACTLLLIVVGSMELMMSRRR